MIEEIKQYKLKQLWILTYNCFHLQSVRTHFPIEEKSEIDKKWKNNFKKLVYP